jgi:hypothetical protein
MRELRIVLESKAITLGFSSDFIASIREAEEFEELIACLSFMNDYSDAPNTPRCTPYCEWEL